MTRVSDDRAAWLARHILPYEAGLRTALSRWRLPHDLDADDVIQEVYGKLAALDTVAAIQQPRAYAFGVARSVVLTHLRRRRIVPIRQMEPGDAADLMAEEPSPETQVSDREQLHLLALAIARLPEPGRSVVRLRKIDDLSYREIGRRVGLSDNAVEKVMARAMRRLLSAIGHGGNGDARASIGWHGGEWVRHDGSRDSDRN